MASLISGKFDNVYNILSGCSVNIISDIPDEFKCVICRKLIIKARQAMCGCSFCEKCIECYKKNDETICPGNSTDCKLDNLTSITINHGLNKQISKLIVKCPDKMCNYECQLIDMSDHLNICLKKVVKCPFNELGCVYDRMENNQLNDHFQSDLHVHNKMFIDIIGNLRNENVELKTDLIKKEERIDKLFAEMELLKTKNNDIFQIMQIKNEKIGKKFLDIFIKYFWKINENNEVMQIESMDQIKENIEKEFNSEIQEIVNQSDLDISKISSKMQQLYLELSNKIQRLEGFLDFNYSDSFGFSIQSIAQLSAPLYSEYFTFRKHPYNMRLKCYNYNARLFVSLCISPGPCDDILIWPFNKDVSITIIASNNQNNQLHYSKMCIINRPSSESCFDIFFGHSRLNCHGLMGTCCTVECYIENINFY